MLDKQIQKTIAKIQAPAVTQYNEEKMNVQSVLNKDLQQLDNVFDKAGFEIRIVGGAVRDIALGKTPKDIDLAIADATPQMKWKDYLTVLVSQHKPTGIEYGTISAIMNGVHESQHLEQTLKQMEDVQM